MKEVTNEQRIVDAAEALINAVGSSSAVAKRAAAVRIDALWLCGFEPDWLKAVLVERLNK